MIKKITKYIFSYHAVIINHIIGLIGLHIEQTQAIFVMLTPFNLWFTALVLLYNSDKTKKGFWIFFFTSFTIGMLVEIAGVQTGLIFGEYYYTNMLGIQLFQVPLIIGINWFVLLYCSLSVVNHFAAKLHAIVKSMIAALSMAVIDFFIEPFAIYFDLWQWQATSVPLQNYFAWFVISLFILLLFGKKVDNYRDNTATITYLVLILFFVANYGLIVLNN